MTHHDDLDHRLVEWFAADAGRRAPAGLVQAITADTRQRRQQPSWLVTLRGGSIGRVGWPFSGARARRVAILVVVAVLAAFAFAVILAGQHRSSPFGVGALAFVRGGNVYLAGADGTGARVALHRDGVTLSTVTWSPDGTRLAMDGDSGVVVLVVGTGAVAEVGGSNPAWSADGRLLAVLDTTQEATTQVTSLRIVDVASGATIAAYPFQAAVNLTWSPDGRWIAATGGDASDSLVRIDVATGRVIQLAGSSGMLDFPREPSWSPDSQHIAYIVWRNGQSPSTHTFPCMSSVVVADADGSNPAFLDPANATAADQPAWSPDGQWIGLREYECRATHDPAIGDEVEAVPIGLAIVHPDGTGRRTIVPGAVEAFSWLPGTQALTFAVNDPTTGVDSIGTASLNGPVTAIDVHIDVKARSIGSWTGPAFGWQPLAAGSPPP
jgi:WD40 domain-containing protein/WD40 repeat protein